MDVRNAAILLGAALALASPVGAEEKRRTIDESHPGGEPPLHSTPPGVIGAQRIRNLLTTVEIRVPAALLGRPPLAAGPELSVGVSFHLGADVGEMAWPVRARRLRGCEGVDCGGGRRP